MRLFSLCSQLESLQETRGQLLKVSEQISSTMRSSQEQLTVKLQQSQTQLEEVSVRFDQTKAQLDQTKTELEHAWKRATHLQSQLDQSQTQHLQSQTQLEQSRTLYEQTRAQNSRLQAQLEHLTAVLNQTRVEAAQLQSQLHASEKSVETSSDSLLIKVELSLVSIMKVACCKFFMIVFFFKLMFPCSGRSLRWLVSRPGSPVWDELQTDNICTITARPSLLCTKSQTLPSSASLLLPLHPPPKSFRLLSALLLMPIPHT